MRARRDNIPKLWYTITMMNNKVLLMSLVMGGGASFAEVVPLPPPVIRVGDLRSDEKPVTVESAATVAADNGLYRRVSTTFTFTNPNARQMSADFEFPLPEGATVCGYALEIDGVMVPGVVTGKEKARVAFESEKAKRVDPGLVEHVKGNVWQTRIFPLLPNTPRKAQVDYIVPLAEGGDATVYERDGEDVFVGVRGAAAQVPAPAEAIAAFASGVILWDASGSAQSAAAAWRQQLDALPETGDWLLVVFRNEAEETPFKEKAALLAFLDALVYDGGTAIGKAVQAAGDRPTLLFTDEIDTLDLDAPRYEERANIVVASRPAPAARAVTVRRLAPGEAPAEGADVKPGTLLATAWAADRIRDLAAQAENRADEFLALGRKYGVASPVTSLIVLESLDQYIEHKIEPPKAMSFHDIWVQRMAAQDDEIALKEADAEHERDLLGLWKERVEWWKNPIPPKRTPSSGLFDRVANALGAVFGSSDDEADGGSVNGRRMPEVEDGMAAPEEEVAARAGGALPGRAFEAPAPAMEKSAAPRTSEAGGGGATITLAAWNPKAPYLDALAKAPDAYAEYLVQKKSQGQAPAFYMDCASFFFRKGDKSLGARILTNMAEFKLEDAAVWRSMGWRLREAGDYDTAILCFRKALKLRNEEGQARRDLALVLMERGKAARNAADLAEAMRLLKETAFTNWARRSGRRSNDRQVSIVALEELNALLAWCHEAKLDVEEPSLDKAYRRDLPVKIRIVLSWDADETDIDLHVLEPDGEEAYYGHRRTSTGGFVSEDVTTGYGPEEYLRKAGSGTFKVLTNYFASHQTALTGAVTATATVYTDWGTAAEKMKILTLRLDKPKDKLLIGEIAVEEEAR